MKQEEINEAAAHGDFYELSDFSYKVPQCSRDIETILNSGEIFHFLNTTIIPPGADGLWNVEEVEPAYIRHCILYVAHQGATNFIQSHIGHEATAAVAREVFGQADITMDRTPWDGTGLGVAIQLKGRLPEGQILGRDELEAIGYTVRVLYRKDGASPEAR